MGEVIRHVPKIIMETVEKVVEVPQVSTMEKIVQVPGPVQTQFVDAPPTTAYGAAPYPVATQFMPGSFAPPQAPGVPMGYAPPTSSYAAPAMNYAMPMQNPGMEQQYGMHGLQQPGMQQPGMQPGMQQPGMCGMQQPGMQQPGV